MLAERNKAVVKAVNHAYYGVSKDKQMMTNYEIEEQLYGCF